MSTKLIFLSLACLVAQGQTFEVASVKPPTKLGPMGMQANRRGGPGSTDPGLYDCQNCPIFWVLSEAYDLPPFQFSRPDWLDEVRFDFSAKIPPGTSKEAFHVMLRNMLIVRFHMVVHREKRDAQLFDLTVAKNGPRFKEAIPKDTPQSDGPPGKLKRDADGFPVLAPGTTMAIVPGHARLQSENRPISWFAGQISNQLHGPVVDSTGLKGNYDFLLSWAFAENNNSGVADVGQPYESALLSAVEEQLGLKLQRKRGQVEMLVVDHMEKTPTEN